MVMYNSIVGKPLAILMLRPDRGLRALVDSNINTEQNGRLLCDILRTEHGKV